jgi:hypothetical protein
MPEPDLVHQEEILRIIFSQHGRTGNGSLEEDAAVQSQAEDHC